MVLYGMDLPGNCVELLGLPVPVLDGPVNCNYRDTGSPCLWRLHFLTGAFCAGNGWVAKGCWDDDITSDEMDHSQKSPAFSTSKLLWRLLFKCTICWPSYIQYVWPQINHSVWRVFFQQASLFLLNPNEWWQHHWFWRLNSQCLVLQTNISDNPARLVVGCACPKLRWPKSCGTLWSVFAVQPARDSNLYSLGQPWAELWPQILCP